MDYVFLSTIIAMTGTALMLFIYIHLYIVHREKYMGAWIISWLAHFTRISLFESGMFDWKSSFFSCITYQMFFIVCATVLIYSAYLVINKSLNRYWLYGATIVSLLSVIFDLMNASVFWKLLPPTWLSAIMLLYIAKIFICKLKIRGAGNYITGYAFFIWGVLTATIPFFANDTSLPLWITLLCGITRLVITSGMLMVYFEKTRADLLSYQESLQQALDNNQELNHFCHSVAHDFKSPLLSINQLAKFIVRDYYDKLDRNGQELVNHIQNKSAEVVTITDHLLELSRMSQKQIKTEPVSLEELFWTVYSELRQMGPQRQVAYTVAELPTVQGDPIMLKILVTNILDNALKYTRNREQTTIDVTFIEDGNNYIISVKDNGVGFDMEYSSKLFEILERLHSVDEFEGTGVGLVTCQKILKRHGGKAWMIGKVDEGATIFFSFPKENSSQPSRSLSSLLNLGC
ncbi:MAG: cph1 6 [Firmicutes bacterium]|nr:cph1 6 [Bacillota bacterium]